MISFLSSDFLRSRAARCSSDLVYCENGSKRTLDRNDLKLISIYTLFDLVSKQKRFVVDQSESFCNLLKEIVTHWREPFVRFKN